MKKLFIAVAVLAAMAVGAQAKAEYFGGDANHLERYFSNDFQGGFALILPHASTGPQRLSLHYISPAGKWRLDQTHDETGFGLVKGELVGNRVLFQPVSISKAYRLLFFADRISRTETVMPLAVLDNTSQSYGLDVNYGFPVGSLSLTVGRNAKSRADLSTLLNTETTQLMGSVGYDILYLDASLYRSSEEIKIRDDADTKIDTTAFLVDVGATVAKRLDLGMTYLYASRERLPENEDQPYLDLAGLGRNRAFYILTGNVIGTADDFVDALEPVLGTEGLKAFGVHADYRVNDLLGLYGAIGYARSNDGTAGLAGDSGWEYNLGAAVRIFNNLTYEAHFGYFASEDSAKPSEEQTTLQANDIYMLSNKLSMTF